MADSKIRIAAVGSKSEGINEINPRFQAEALRNIRGIDCGVLDNSFYSEDVDPYGVTKTANPDSFMFPIDISSYTVSIGRGMATAYGYDFQTEETIAITTLEDGTPLSQLSPGTATYYLFVYLEWNLAASPAEGSIKIHNNGTASIWRSLVTENSSNNLIRIPSGTYKLPIWRFTCTSTGLGNAVSWEDMNLCPTIKRPQVAEVARFADDPTGVGDEIANTRYVTNRCDEDMAAMQSAIDAINSNFLRDTFTILNVPCDILKRMGIVYISWTGERGSLYAPRLDNLSEGDILGQIPNEFYPKEDTEILIFVKAYNANGSTDTYPYGLIRAIISKDNGNVIFSNFPWYEPNITRNAYFDFIAFNIGYETATESIPTIYTKHPLILNYDSSKVCATAPTYYEIGTPFTLKAIATGYGEECVIDVTGGSISGGADGEYTVTPTSTVCVVSISTRYFGGGTDENGDDGVTGAPQLTMYMHTISLRGGSDDSMHVYITFTVTNYDTTAYDSFEKISDYFGTSEITATGIYGTGSEYEYEIVKIIVDKDYTFAGSSATGYVRVWITDGSTTEEAIPAVFSFFTDISDTVTEVKV